MNNPPDHGAGLFHASGAEPYGPLPTGMPGQGGVPDVTVKLLGTAAFERPIPERSRLAGSAPVSTSRR